MRLSQPLLPITYVAFGICEQFDDIDIYGYVSLTANKNTKLKTQSSYNLYARKFLESKLMDKLLYQFESINENTIRQNIELDTEIDINRPILLYENENISINRGFHILVSMVKLKRKLHIPV